MIVLDTTVLVYAKGVEHPLRGPCRELIGAVAGGDMEATTSVEAIQEFVHVRARRRGRDDAAALGRDYAELLSPLLVLDEEVLRDGLGLFERVPSVGAFDAVLVSAATAAGATAVVSADTGFGDIPGLPHVVPDTQGVATLLKR